MRLDLEKLAQPIPSVDATDQHLNTGDLFSLAQKLDIPLNIDDVHTEEAIASDHMGSMLSQACQPNTALAALLLKGRESGQTVRDTQESRSIGPLIPDAEALMSNSFLMEPIPEQLLTVNDDAASKSVEQLTAETSSKEPRVSRSSASPTKGRSGTRGSRHSRRSTKTTREVVKQETTVENWAQCESCKKWRRLPATVDTEKLPDLWVCALNVWDSLHNSCDVPEETFADLKHAPEPEPVVTTKRTKNTKLALPIRPVVASTSGKSHVDHRQMDHEVIELLLSDQGDYPLRERFTLHSLDRASLLASELPHDVLMLGDIPNKRNVKANDDFINGAGHLIRPDEDLLKDDPSSRDDGTFSLGIAQKTQWHSQDHDASTIDTVDGVDSMMEPPSRSTLTALFPRLALQVPKLQTLKLSQTNLHTKRDTSSNVAKPRKGTQKEVLSAMNNDDLMGVVSYFVPKHANKEPARPRKHCQLEEKMRTCTIPMESFLQPLFMLALPLPYPNTNGAMNNAAYSNQKPPLKTEDLHTDKTGPESLSVTPSYSKREQRRKVAKQPTKVTATQPANYTEKQLSKMREEYVRRSVGKSYFKNLKTAHPDIDYPAPDSKRISKGIANRYARGNAAVHNHGLTDDLSLNSPIDTATGRALTERLHAMEIPEQITIGVEHTRAFHNSDPLFGVDMAHAMALLNQPIALDIPSTKENPASRQVGLCGLTASISGALNVEIPELPGLEMEGVDINMEIYKNPRLLTEV